MTTRADLGQESGSITIWLLGLALGVLFVGGIGLDLWRIAAERRALAGVVDGAAVAGASVIDEAAFREHGLVRLDPPRATAAACSYLQHHARPASSCAGVSASTSAVRVEVERAVGFTLLRTLLPDLEPVRLRVSATVEPRPSG